MRKNKFINQRTDYAIQTWMQRIRIVSGRAERGHQEAAHSGKFDPNCQACIDLKKKRETLQ